MCQPRVFFGIEPLEWGNTHHLEPIHFRVWVSVCMCGCGCWYCCCHHQHCFPSVGGRHSYVVRCSRTVFIVPIHIHLWSVWIFMRAPSFWLISMQKAFPFTLFHTFFCYFLFHFGSFHLHKCLRAWKRRRERGRGCEQWKHKHQTSARHVRLNGQILCY